MEFNWVKCHYCDITCNYNIVSVLYYNNNNNNDRLTAFDPGQPG